MKAEDIKQSENDQQEMDYSLLKKEMDELVRLMFEEPEFLPKTN